MPPLGFILLGLVGGSVLYLVTAAGYLHFNRPWLALTFLGYIIANVGLVLDALQQR